MNTDEHRYSGENLNATTRRIIGAAQTYWIASTARSALITFAQPGVECAFS
jgi:hypothetical protein